MTTNVSQFRPRQRPPASGRVLPPVLPEFLRRYMADGDAAVAQPFRGVTTAGTRAPGLFPLRKTGVSTRPIADAADGFLAALSAEQRAQALLPLDSDAWRRWSNIHIYVIRHGALLEAMSDAQREAAFGLLRASLSPTGFQTARDIMRLNETIGEMTEKPEEYGEWLYWLSVFGTPTPEAAAPWGWQIDGHHLIVNCLLLGDQLVMTPLFMGSEPCEAPSGKYAGTRVFEAEERDGLALMQSLSPEQRRVALLSDELPHEVFTTAFRDNFELTYEGIRFDALSDAQQRLLLRLIETYTGRARADQAAVKLDEVKQHLGETYFAWMGGCEDDSVFYYRVHSPVILIEFDHESGIAFDNEAPTRQHIHTVVRTPNGNDYGKDLLRQHHEQVAHEH
ncbi:MAG TPA: DUF3500 domain-containing protein [Dehalococcoidia bacterium]|nr:DUF3500 domain-containing protein [Dehalococcoidia bacterium]